MQYNSRYRRRLERPSNTFRAYSRVDNHRLTGQNKVQKAKTRVYLTVGSQPQAVMLPLLQAAVTAYVTPAELIAYVKAASLLPEIDQ